MGILLTALLLADQELPYPKIKPFQTIQLADLPHDYTYDNSLRNRVLIDPIGKTVLAFHHANLLTVVDLASSKLQPTITFGKPSPERITLEGRVITFHDRPMNGQKPEDRKYDLDKQVELRVPKAPYEYPPEDPKQRSLYNLLYKEKRRTALYHQLDEYTVLTIEGRFAEPWQETTINIRSLDTLKIINTAPFESIADNIYFSPDKKILAAKCEGGSYTDLYSTQSLKRLRRVWNELGHLEFDPHNLWAANHGVVRWYYSIYGLRPLLVNLKTFNVYLLGDPPHGIHDVAIDSSLNLGVTIGEKSIDFYRLPKK